VQLFDRFLDCAKFVISEQPSPSFRSVLPPDHRCLKRRGLKQLERALEPVHLTRERIWNQNRNDDRKGVSCRRTKGHLLLFRPPHIVGTSVHNRIGIAGYDGYSWRGKLRSMIWNYVQQKKNFCAMNCASARRIVKQPRQRHGGITGSESAAGRGVGDEGRNHDDEFINLTCFFGAFFVCRGRLLQEMNSTRRLALAKSRLARILLFLFLWYRFHYSRRETLQKHSETQARPAVPRPSPITHDRELGSIHRLAHREVENLQPSSVV